jgi:ATP-dependent Clp protease protease subunit
MNVIRNFSPLLKEPQLLQNPVVIRINKFDEPTAKAFSSAVGRAHNTSQTVLPIIIDSYGGQVYSLLSMISDIKHCKLPVATIIQGKAMSCGAILFSFGDEGMRYMDPDATLMIHDVSSMEYGKVEEIKASAEETERLNQKIYHMMAENCGHHKDYFLDIVHQKGHADWFLESDAAKKHNLANHLHVPQMEINIDVRFDFK